MKTYSFDFGKFTRDDPLERLRFAIITQAIEDYEKSFAHYLKTGRKTKMFNEVVEFFESEWGFFVTNEQCEFIKEQVENHVRKKYKKFNRSEKLDIRTERIKRGLTQVDLAKLINTNPHSIVSVETGKVSLTEKMAKRIAKALDVDWRKFL